MAAGDLSDRFPVSKATMSAHFAVLREAGLVDATKHGRSIIYRLKLSVLEDALLGFSQILRLGEASSSAAPSPDSTEGTTS